MTAPAPSPKPRSKRIYVMWGVALAVLLGLGAFCWLVVVPVMEVHAAAKKLSMSKIEAAAAVSTLGDESAAARKISLYMRLPNSLASQRRQVIPMLRHCGAAGLPVLIKALGDEDEWIRDHAGVNIPTIEGSQEALMRAMRESDVLVRRNATMILGIYNCEGKVPVFMSATGDPDARVREYAVNGLGGEIQVTPDLQLENRANVTLRLMELLARDPAPAVRAEAAKALAEFAAPPKDVMTALSTAQRDADESVRQAATDALKKIKAAQEKKQ